MTIFDLINWLNITIIVAFHRKYSYRFLENNKEHIIKMKRAN